MYSITQKVLFPFVIVPIGLILLFLYRFGKRPLKGTQSMTDRLELLYSFSGATLLGVFFFQALPNSTGPSGTQVGMIATGFTFIGLFIMIIIQKCQRVTQENPFFVSPELNSVEIRSIVDSEKMELVDYYQASDLESGKVSEDRLKLADEIAELKKRRRICILTILIMSLLAIFEGFFILYREPTALLSNWTIFTFFITDKMVQTVVIGTSLLHAFYHSTKRRWYLITSIWWMLVCMLSTVPVLANMNWTDCFTMVNHVATSIFYACAGGVLLWIALYYVWIDRIRVDKADTSKRLVVFGGVAVVCWLNGFFI